MNVFHVVFIATAVAGVAFGRNDMVDTSPETFCDAIDEDIDEDSVSSMLQKNVRTLARSFNANISLPASGQDASVAGNTSESENSTAVSPKSALMLQIATFHNVPSLFATIFNSHKAHLVEIVLLFAIPFASILLMLLDFRTQDLEKKSKRKHSALYSMMSSHSHRTAAAIWQTFIASVVIISIFAICFQSDPRVNKRYEMSFQITEGVCSWIFLMEYCLRLYVIPESNRYRNMTASMARLRWMISVEAMIDFLATFPYFIEIISEGMHPGAGVKLPTLTWLRVFRLFHLFKVSFVSESIDVFVRVLYYNAEILLVALILCMVLVLFLSVLLFILAPKNTKDEDYSSILSCMFLAVMMLTGQGQPPGVLPWYTKIIVCITCIFAVGLFAIQASMLTWGFENEAGRRVKKNHRIRQQRVKAILDGRDPNAEHESSSSEDENEVDSDWEEYEEFVAGVEIEEESDSDQERIVDTHPVNFSDEEKRAMKTLFSEKEGRYVHRLFYYLDVSADGKITKSELEGLDGVNARKLFKRMDKNGKDISKLEFMNWLWSIKNTHSSVVFKMVLEDLLEACKTRKERKDELEDESSMPQEIMDFAKRFKDLQRENQKLKKQIGQLRASKGT
mmetsp:Transcript_139511/g.255883  ORF Transcript_139511/g.255883 Transcript_139511/m.255883 type:complete len:621 (-) Transcript_139511:72-1934(-)